MMKYLIKLVIGDWSGDGHNQTESVIIRSNFGVEEIQEAYDKSVEILGFDLVNDICTEYDDNELPLEILEKLKKFGYPGIDNLDPDFVYYDTFTNIYLWMVKLGSVENLFEFEILHLNVIDIGGYGLFHS